MIDLIKAVSEELNIPTKKVKEIISMQSKGTKEFLSQGKSVKWSFLGKFLHKVSKVFSIENGLPIPEDVKIKMDYKIKVKREKKLKEKLTKIKNNDKII